MVTVTPKVLPMICVESVSASAKLLRELLGWSSTHGGDDFEELIDSDSTRVLWLHAMSAPEHARFADNTSASANGVLGRGLAIYVFVDDIDATYLRAAEADVVVVEELATNPNAGFREFTFREPNGYHFTVAEPPSG